MMEHISKNHKFALMMDSEKKYLHQLAALIPNGGIVLEVGTFLGASSSIMAHANPNITIHTIDMYWDDHDRDRPWVQDMLNSALGKFQPRTLESVSKIVSEYKNIKLYKGFSPKHFMDWNIEIDLYFEDGFHTNPRLENNINFWSKFIKKRGYLVLHDHRPNLPIGHPSRFVDTETCAVSLLNEGYKKIDQIDGMLILQKL